MGESLHLPASSDQLGVRGLRPPHTGPADHDARALVETRPSERSVGLYLHVPFCTKRCYFCSFNTAPMDDSVMARYLAAVGREIELLAAVPWASGLSVESVFLGGGTPSLLGGDEMQRVLDSLRARFTVHEGAEVTVESNPESLDVQK